MKQRIVFVASAFFLALLFAFRQAEKNRGQRIFNSDKLRNTISCGPDWNQLKEWMDENEIPPIPGSGNHKWKITTNHDSAQFYFNQGMNMYYSFHIIEAMASFQKAAKFDPASAMVYWAKALGYGPNINDVGYAASPDAIKAIEQAIELSGNSTPVEKMLITAQRVRYSEDSTASRAMLNQLYVDKMREAYARYPAHADVAALYADAMMLQHPWDLWKNDGTPRPWTPLIREVLEKLLQKHPNHPGANHYYIHVMEPSPFAAKALPSADRLGKLTPALSHTVHMPSHIYLRTGHFIKGSQVNVDAVNSYKKSISLYAPVTGNDFLYEIHNLHMQTNNAMMAGRSGYSLHSAKATVNSIPKDYLSIPAPMGSYIQYINMTPTLVNVRFGNWNTLLNEPKPESSQVYGNLLHHFGKGMAQANHSKLIEAKNELEQLQQLLRDNSLTLPFFPFSAAIEGAIVAEQILKGTIALKEKKSEEAIAAFQKAVETDDNMVYNEPRDWLLNPRHYLGNALLKAGKYAEAKIVLERDLENNNENGWALFGIWQALTAQKKKAEAEKILARFRKAFSKADIKLYGAVF